MSYAVALTLRQSPITMLCTPSFISPSPAPDKLTTISIKTPFRNQCTDDKEKVSTLLTDYVLLLLAPKYSPDQTCIYNYVKSLKLCSNK